MLESLLVPIAVHSMDIITTKILLCVSKSAFANTDIWHIKLKYEFPKAVYINFKNSKNKRDNNFKNYRMRKLGNCFISYTKDAIQNTLYQCCNKLQTMNFFLKSSFKNSDMRFIHIKITDRYILIEDDNFNQVGCYPSISEGRHASQMRLLEICKEYRDYPFKLRIDFYLLDLENMYFYSPNCDANDTNDTNDACYTDCNVETKWYICDTYYITKGQISKKY